MVLRRVQQLEELRAAHDVIEVGVREGDNVEVIARRLLQLVLKARLEIDLWRLRVFSVRAMAKVEEDPSALRQDDLRRVAVSYGIKNHSVCFGHRFSPSLLALFSFSEPDERAGMATLTRLPNYLIL